MEILAVGAAALCALVSISTFRFQRFTLKIAREIGEGAEPRDVGARQQRLTPTWMRRLEYLGYLLAIAAIVFGSQEFGWIWGAAIVVGMLFGRGLVSPFWPLPSMRQCLAIARQEATRGLTQARSDGDQQEQAYVALITRLDSVRMS
jgi:hypothetical protein